MVGPFRGGPVLIGTTKQTRPLFSKKNTHLKLQVIYIIKKNENNEELSSKLCSSNLYTTKKDFISDHMTRRSGGGDKKASVV